MTAQEWKDRALKAEAALTQARHDFEAQAAALLDPEAMAAFVQKMTPNVVIVELANRVKNAEAALAKRDRIIEDRTLSLVAIKIQLESGHGSSALGTAISALSRLPPTEGK